MNKLLYANLIRLRKSKILGINNLISILVVIIICFNQYKLLREYADVLGEGHPDSFMLGSISYLGILFSIFCSLFIGTEYSDGVIRNKIMVGALRRNIYMANFITCMISSIATYLLCFLTGCILAIPMFGPPVLPLPQLFLLLLDGILVCTTFAAIYNFIAMTLSNKTHAAIVCILLGILLLAISAYLLNALQQPEMVESVEIITSGMEPEVVLTNNPHYVTGFQRSLYEFLNDFLPTGQGIQINQLTVAHPFRLAACSVVIILGMNLAGLYFFERKDIK